MHGNWSWQGACNHTQKMAKISALVCTVQLCHKSKQKHAGTAAYYSSWFSLILVRTHVAVLTHCFSVLAIWRWMIVKPSQIPIFVPNPEKMTDCSKMWISEPLKSRFLRQILINAVISKYWDFNRIFMDLAQKSDFRGIWEGFTIIHLHCKPLRQAFL